VPSKEDPSIVPLGMPLIAGPGAISTVMVLVGQARDGVTDGARAGHRRDILLTHPATAPTIVTRIGVTGQRMCPRSWG
jgi:multiple antibiotic resistance protein